MYTLNIASTIKKMTLNELRDFIFESYYKRIGFVKESSYYSMKRLNDKEHSQSFLIKKNTKSVKQSKINTQQPKHFENLNIFDIKSAIMEHPKTSDKLFKTIRQAEKVSKVGSGKISNSSLQNKVKSLLTKKM